MTVDLVPSTDLAPSLPSRIVTVNVLDVQEGGWAAGESVHFSLVGDVHVSADQRIVLGRKGVRLPLTQGRGAVRLPVWTGATGEWAVKVQPSWTPHPYFIRVPAGASSIDLSQINPLTEVPPGLTQWLITNASATISEGGQWGVTVNASGGTAAFHFTVPPFGQNLYRGNLPAGTNLDTVRGQAWEGVWDIAPADVSSMLGTWPTAPNGKAKHYGSLLVFGRVSALKNIGAQILSYANVDPGTGEASLWYRSNQGYNTSGAIAWTEFRRLDSGTDVAAIAADVATLSGVVEDITETGSGPGGNAGLAHATLRDRFIRARGGRIGTNGRAAVAIRWDHNPDTPITNGVVDLHRDRGIPWGWVHYSRQLGTSRHTTSWATLEQYALNYGAEVWGHGATHLDATDLAGYVDELATSRAELRAAMPSQLVDCFALPGVGGTNMGGFTIATRPEAIYNTLAGRIAAENYALISGQVGAGVPYPLTGQPADLMAHLYIQSMTGADVIARIKEAQARSEGLQLMLHPNWIGAAGGISTADYTAILNFLRDERDAGRLAVPSLSGLHLCDAGSSYRHDLARNPRFADGLTGWSGTGWTVAAGVASGSSPLTQDLNMTDLAWARGACRETVLEVRALSGTATVALIRNGATVANVSVGTAWTTIRRTTYLSMTRGTDTTTVSPSAAVEVRACHLYAN